MADIAIIPVPGITDEQKISVGVDPRTEGTSTQPEGKPAPIDGNVTWSVEDGDVTIESIGSEAEKTVNIVSGTANSTYRVRAKADADLGEGVVEIAVDFAGVVTQAGAAELATVVGTPVQK